jgi:hypothetical protein
MIENITKTDFDAVLPKWKIDEDNHREYVYTFPLSSRPHIVIKVFSSIDKRNNFRREVGKDAIRICAVNTQINRGWIGTTRVYRTLNWKDNLKKAVLVTFEKARKRH